MSEWDPIGVNDIPEATDEYDGYVGPVLDLLNASASSDEIAAYLRNVETERMNLTDAQGKPLLPAQNRNRAVHSLKLLIPHGRIPGKLGRRDDTIPASSALSWQSSSGSTPLVPVLGKTPLRKMCMSSLYSCPGFSSRPPLHQS
jgi:hypothetical protein